MINGKQLRNINIWTSDSLGYGQPDTIEVKYKNTYYKIGKLLAKYPEIRMNLRVSGLGSTRPVEAIREIYRGLRSQGNFSLNLSHYWNFELGGEKGFQTLYLLKQEAIPSWHSVGFPISLIQGNILHSRHYQEIKDINLFDFDSTNSLSSKLGATIPEQLVDTLSISTGSICLVHINTVIKSFRVKGSTREFFNNQLPKLLDKLKTRFSILDLETTNYTTKTYRSITEMGGCIVVIRRK